MFQVRHIMSRISFPQLWLIVCCASLQLAPPLLALVLNAFWMNASAGHSSPMPDASMDGQLPCYLYRS